MIELEKQWYIKRKDIPLNKITEVLQITQTYSVSNDIMNARIRKTNIKSTGKTEFSHTVKYYLDTKTNKGKNNNTASKREELEESISSEQYDNIFEVINKTPLKKDRYIIPLKNDLIAEVDNFLDTDEIIVEVEFKDEKEMDEFQKPSWFGDEVKSSDSSNTNKSYSIRVFDKINDEFLSDLDKLNMI